jgi:ribosome-binding protein aMBF1 (putative translation factor)
MPVCKQCGEEAEELHAIKVQGRRRRVCEDCVELIEEEQAIAEESEAVIQQMMGYKGRR